MNDQPLLRSIRWNSLGLNCLLNMTNSFPASARSLPYAPARLAMRRSATTIPMITLQPTLPSFAPGMIQPKNIQINPPNNDILFTSSHFLTFCCFSVYPFSQISCVIKRIVFIETHQNNNGIYSKLLHFLSDMKMFNRCFHNRRSFILLQKSRSRMNGSCCSIYIAILMSG